MQEEDGEDKRGMEKRKGEGKVEKNQRSVWVCLQHVEHVCTRLLSTTNQRRSCRCQATLRGYWGGGHCTEEWGNIMVSSFESQRHVGSLILITGFMTAPVIDFTLCFLQRIKSNHLNARRRQIFIFIRTFVMVWS